MDQPFVVQDFSNGAQSLKGKLRTDELLREQSRLLSESVFDYRQKQMYKEASQNSLISSQDYSLDRAHYRSRRSPPLVQQGAMRFAKNLNSQERVIVSKLLKFHYSQTSMLDNM